MGEEGNEIDNIDDHRSVRRAHLEQRAQAFTDYQKTLQIRLENGEITDKEHQAAITRAVLRREIRTANAKRLATEDPLTGLPNRRAFDETYANLISKGKPFGLLIIDIDNFKKVNDEHGHKVGDNVLTQVSLLSASSIRGRRDIGTSEDSIAKTGTLGRIRGSTPWYNKC